VEAGQRRAARQGVQIRDRQGQPEAWICDRVELDHDGRFMNPGHVLVGRVQTPAVPFVRDTELSRS